MSEPYHLSLSSEIVSAMSVLNLYPDNKTDGLYISQLYPEAIAAMSFLKEASSYMMSSSDKKLFIIDIDSSLLHIYDDNFSIIPFLSITDDIPYRKNLLLARESLLSIKHLCYEIGHSIEHIDSALSFTSFYLNDFASFIYSTYKKDLSNEAFIDLLSSYVELRSTLREDD